MKFQITTILLSLSCLNAGPIGPILTTIGYMYQQTTDQNACGINGNQVQNQVALSVDVFNPTLCGQMVEVTVGPRVVQGVVIDALSSYNRMMLSQDLFSQIAPLELGIVQGTVVIENHATPFVSNSNIPQFTSSPFPSSSSAAIQDEESKLGQMAIPQIDTQNPIHNDYQHILYSSDNSQSLDATFYYSADGKAGACGPANGITNYPESHGITFCEKNQGYKTIFERGTDDLVAMPYSILRSGENKALLCGKKIIVTIDGKKRDDLNLFIGDACDFCSSNGGLDFSSNMFADLFGVENCAKGRISNRMTYEIVDERVVDWYE